jgi:hypothetical protein
LKKTLKSLLLNYGDLLFSKSTKSKMELFEYYPLK